MPPIRETRLLQLSPLKCDVGKSLLAREESVYQSNLSWTNSTDSSVVSLPSGFDPPWPTIDPALGFCNLLGVITYHVVSQIHFVWGVEDLRNPRNLTMPLVVNRSVLPPPPRYPVPQTTINANGQTVTTTPPVVEMSNVLTHLTGPEFQLSVGEGTYVLRDSLQLATPPPHPQDAPAVSTNPLATTLSPPKAGVKLSICITDPKKTSPRLYMMDTSSTTGSNLGTYSIKELERESRSSHDTSSDGPGSQPGHSSAPSRTPIFGEDNVALTPAMSKDALKRKKPKTNLVKSNSQFISRVIPHDNLTRRLQDHNPEGIFIFANIDRAYQWLDMSSPVASKPGLIDYHLKSSPAPLKSEQAQPLMKILFARAHMLCHDINSFTKSPNHIDVIMGASTGDIVWFEAFSQKYVRINKGVCIKHVLSLLSGHC